MAHLKHKHHGCLLFKTEVTRLVYAMPPFDDVSEKVSSVVVLDGSIMLRVIFASGGNTIANIMRNPRAEVTA
jgi:hypothetical protein